MKVSVLSLSLATCAAASLFSAAPESDSSPAALALFWRPLGASSSASAQCMGECQGDAEGSGPRSAATEAGDEDGAASSAIARVAVLPSESVASASEGNHIVVAATPVIEMLYSYLGLADDAPLSAAAGSAASSDRPVNRLVAELLGSLISARSTDANAASITPVSTDAISAALAKTFEPLFDIEWEAPPARNIVFDLDSWGYGIESAAQRLASSVKSFAIEVMPELSQTASADSAATLAADPRSASEDGADEPSPTRWFR
ncbi:hypothetical protein H4R21_003488 [Coemansia helicoidea]|uniref:Uncharacterized protein n=1 Tax=Coemansia helicoidea TaxID=1286919 RepID=A0ACC1L2F0_9FUNG|nr:hypothetical protein H4R21_003488 [Coemansia helicoidea]